MKRLFAVAVAAAAVALSGCEMLNKKDNDDQGGTAAGGGGGINAEYVSVADTIAPAKADRLQKGYAIEQQTEAGGQTYPTRYRVVGETADAWQVEHYGATLAFQAAEDKEDYIIGLTVDKDSGKVTSAVLGKEGEAGTPIKVNETPAMGGSADAPAGTDTEVALGMGGPFPAKKIEMNGTTTWTGTQGELEGIMLKQESAQGTNELAEMPSTESVDAGGTQVEVTKLKYTDGMEVWVTENDVVSAFFPWGEGKGYFKMKTAGSAQTVTEVGTDAEPKLKWE